MRDDRELIARYEAGDETGFETFYERHRRPVYVYLLSFVRNRSVAEELLQEAFCTFLRNLVRVRDGGADLRSCLYRMARSRAIDYLRRERREDRALRERSEDPMFRPRASHFGLSSGLSEDSAYDGEKMGRLLHGLPDAQRETIVLKIFVGMTFAQIGELGSISENTVVSRYRYGIEKLRASLMPGGCKDAR